MSTSEREIIPIYSHISSSSSHVTNHVTSSTPGDVVEPVVYLHNTSLTVFIVIVTSLMTIWCISGNILVIVAVFRVKKLRRTYNFLLVSLAISDLLVGVIVMPLAMLQLILDAWPLGEKICSMWVTFDVTSCTCSILNLMMITIDRYLAITKPLKYPRHRKAKLMIVYISIAWAVSLLISVTPLFVGWGPEFGANGKGCKVNQQTSYQMYATFVAFYLPLMVMLILYGKIYLISKKYAKADAKDHPTLSNNNDEDSITPSYHSSCNGSPVIELKNSAGKRTRQGHLATQELMSTSAVDSSLSLHTDHNVIDDTIAEDTSSLELPRETDWLRGNERYSNHLTVNNAYNNNHTHSTDSPHHHHYHHHHHHHHSHNHLHHPHHPHHATKFGFGPLKKLSAVTIASVQKFLTRHKHSHNTHAIKTLGVIMGLFTACWLPFFILAVVSPLCGDACKIPDSVYSVFLWIGYVNSCFNPIIYARFNRQFRTPFREIICCRCSNLTQSVRRTDYIDQYGLEEEKHHHHHGNGH